MEIDKYLNIVKADFPNITEDKIQVFDHGWDFLIMAVGGKAYRFPRGEYGRKGIVREAPLLRELSTEVEIRIPVFELHGEGESVYATYDFIPGIPFETPIYEKFSAEEKITASAKLGRFLTVLHDFPLDKLFGFGFERVDPVQYWQDSLDRTKEAVKVYLNDQENGWVNQKFEEFLRLIADNPFPTTLTHFDLYYSNIIVDSQTHVLEGIIDFGDAQINDPAYDLYEFGPYYGPEFADGVWRNYRRQKDPTFDRRLKFYQDRLPIFSFAMTLGPNGKGDFETERKAMVEYIERNPL